MREQGLLVNPGTLLRLQLAVKMVLNPSFVRSSKFMLNNRAPGKHAQHGKSPSQQPARPVYYSKEDQFPPFELPDPTK